MYIDNKYYYLLYSDYRIKTEFYTKFIKTYSFNEKYQFIRKHFFSILGEQSGLEPTLWEISKEDLPEAFNYLYSLLMQLLNKDKMNEFYYYDLWPNLFIILMEITKDLKEYSPNRYHLRLYQLKIEAIKYDLKYHIEVENLTELVTKQNLKEL